MSPTLVEIAKQAGVSRSTVSRVINNHPNVDQATRARVRLVAESLNYQPNIAARGLAVGRTRILGLAIPMVVSALFSDPYFPDPDPGHHLHVQRNGPFRYAVACRARVRAPHGPPDPGGGMIDGVIIASALMNDPHPRGIGQARLAVCAYRQACGA